MNRYYVYFMSNKCNTTLYVGVTADLVRRVLEHKASINKSSFTSKYRCEKLVYVETYAEIREAIYREKQIKNWKREWKNRLVDDTNKDWEDLMVEG